MMILLFTLLAISPVDKILGAREHVITAEEIRSLGEKADRILIGVAGDARSSHYKRTRAIIALRHAPSQESLAFLRDVLSHEDVLDLAAAIGSLQPYGDEVFADVLPFLTHANAGVRHAAVLTLAPLPRAETALRTRLYIERDPAVRDALGKILSRAP
jgi:hypothetical protein